MGIRKNFHALYYNWLNVASSSNKSPVELLTKTWAIPLASSTSIVEWVSFVFIYCFRSISIWLIVINTIGWAHWRIWFLSYIWTRILAFGLRQNSLSYLNWNPGLGSKAVLVLKLEMKSFLHYRCFHRTSHRLYFLPYHYWDNPFYTSGIYRHVQANSQYIPYERSEYIVNYARRWWGHPPQILRSKLNILFQCSKSLQQWYFF